MTGHRPTEEVSTAGASKTASAASSTPFLRVVRGDPAPEEVAALVAVLATVGGSGDRGARLRRRSEWNAPYRLHRRALPSGPGGWRASALPR